MVQIAALLQLAWPASLLHAGSGAAARKGQSWVRHFAMPFASSVVNAANADHAPRCVGVWHRMAVCSAHGYAGSIASPGGGALPFWACIMAAARMTVAAATVSAAWAQLAMACGHRSASALWLCALSVISLDLDSIPTPPPLVSHAHSRARGLHHWAACWAGLRVHVSRHAQRWSICSLKRAAHLSTHNPDVHVKLKEKGVFGP